MADLYHVIGPGYLEVWCSWKDIEALREMGYSIDSFCLVEGFE